MRTGKRTSIGEESYQEATEKKKSTYETKRAMVEIFQDVNTYIINASEAFYKSNLRDIGLDAKTGRMYINCFEIAQKIPRIRVQRTGNSTVIGKEMQFTIA